MKFYIDASIFSDESGFFGLLSGSVVMNDVPAVGEALQLFSGERCHNIPLLVEQLRPVEGTPHCLVMIADLNFQDDKSAHEFAMLAQTHGFFIDLHADLLGNDECNPSAKG